MDLTFSSSPQRSHSVVTQVRSGQTVPQWTTVKLCKLELVSRWFFTCCVRLQRSDNCADKCQFILPPPHISSSASPSSHKAATQIGCGALCTLSINKKPRNPVHFDPHIWRCDFWPGHPVSSLHQAGPSQRELAAAWTVPTQRARLASPDMCTWLEADLHSSGSRHVSLRRPSPRGGFSARDGQIRGVTEEDPSIRPSCVHVSRYWDFFTVTQFFGKNTSQAADSGRCAVLQFSHECCCKALRVRNRLLQVIVCAKRTAVNNNEIHLGLV